MSTVGDTMMHVGDIMSTVGVFSTVGIPSFVITLSWHKKNLTSKLKCMYLTARVSRISLSAKISVLISLISNLGLVPEKNKSGAQLQFVVYVVTSE